MSIIETITDVNNTFLSRRELTCNFAGLAGKLKKLEAIDMINKEFKLDGKVIIPMGLKTHVGKATITGTFYVYGDEGLAKKHVNPTIFSRLDRTKAKLAEQKAAAEEKSAEAKTEEKPVEKKTEEKPAEASTEKKTEEKSVEKKPAEKKTEEKPVETKTEEKPAEEKSK